MQRSKEVRKLQPRRVWVAMNPFAIILMRNPQGIGANFLKDRLRDCLLSDLLSNERFRLAIYGTRVGRFAYIGPATMAFRFPRSSFPWMQDHQRCTETLRHFADFRSLASQSGNLSTVQLAPVSAHRSALRGSRFDCEEEPNPGPTEVAQSDEKKSSCE